MYDPDNAVVLNIGIGLALAGLFYAIAAVVMAPDPFWPLLLSGLAMFGGFWFIASAL